MIFFSPVALLALAYVSCLVNASPLVGRDNLDVAAPPVTYPTEGVVWKAGEKQTVTWDTSNLPVHITNPTGKVVLGWQDDSGLNLQIDTPLADGFPITAGKVDIVVPSQYPDRDTYIIALIGSSGNISPPFTITGGSSKPNAVDPRSSSISTPPTKPTSVPDDTPPSKTQGPSVLIMHDGPSSSPNPSSSIHSSPVSPSSPSSVSSSSPSPSVNAENSNGNTSSGNSAWVKKPANTMVIALFAASLVTLFL